MKGVRRTNERTARPRTISITGTGMVAAGAMSVVATFLLHYLFSRDGDNETRTTRTGYEPGQEEEGTLFSGLCGGPERGTGPPVPAPAAAVADRHPYMQSQYLPLKG